MGTGNNLSGTGIIISENQFIMKPQGNISDHISVCICTYKRPQLLFKLLSKLQGQITENLFTYSAVIVDNDALQSAEKTVREWQSRSVISIDYHCEPEQNISLARNKAVANAKGNFIAFIDDDEFPESTWLINLLKTQQQYEADAVLGPVRPDFPPNAPAWLIKSGLCERSEHATGTILHWGQTRTGNTLLYESLFLNKDDWFDPEFGRTGGEDTMFFKKHYEAGKKFVWCNEAPVYETVPQDRWTRQFYIKKNLRIGNVVGDNLRKKEGEFALPSALSSNNHAYHKQTLLILSKSLVWILSMAAALPFSVCLGRHFYMRCLSKLSYNFGVLAGFSGLVFIRYRD